MPEHYLSTESYLPINHFFNYPIIKKYIPFFLRPNQELIDTHIQDSLSNSHLPFTLYE
jgi:hypothetical protein